MPFTYQTGFNVWSSSVVGAAVKPIAFGYSKPKRFFIIEGATSLVFSAAAAIMMALQL
jgi:hypothetical protein